MAGWLLGWRAGRQTSKQVGWLAANQANRWAGRQASRLAGCLVRWLACQILDVLDAGCPMPLAVLALGGAPGLHAELGGAALTGGQACPCAFAVSNEQPHCRKRYRSVELEGLETRGTESPSECHMAGSSANRQCVLKPGRLKEERVEGLLNDEMDLPGPAEHDQPRPQFASLSNCLLHTVI